ncbi:hypothetical protein CK203_064152 [Vitis vinifera]|uniref:Uncharacterized protein n=1 Tax=Vitis vinifera TaxID=29760 RepID=A0A438G5P5_VITVI|nr:hypothetical protein CK203_064152 [Vitis vinifera]
MSELSGKKRPAMKENSSRSPPIEEDYESSHHFSRPARTTALMDRELDISSFE